MEIPAWLSIAFVAMIRETMSDLEQQEQKWRRWRLAGVCAAIGGPLLGMTATVTGMMNAFDRLGTTGKGDPSHLSKAIGEVLVFAFAGFVVAVPGVIGAIVAAMKLRELRATKHRD